MNVSRRRLCLGLSALGILPARLLRAEAAVRLDWQDLLPDTDAAPSAIAAPALGAHDEATLAALQPASSGVRTDWNGQTISLPGFVVPLDYSGTGVTQFLLVPYVGACIHVPPPPANQLVLVSTARPYVSAGLFAPVTVTGTLATATTSTALADVGYALTADRIAPYTG